MPTTYERTPLPHHSHVEHERVSAVPLAGIAQIPDDADRWWKVSKHEIPAALQGQCDAAIQAALSEHSRRRLELLRNSSYSRGPRYRLDKHHDEEDDADNDEELD